MASNTRRAELIAEIAALQQEHLESFRDATFQGWTPLTKAAHDKRAKCIADLQHEFYALDPKPPSRSTRSHAGK
jgi:2,4-dienoyl-CoA reductase-like NADH-dependent reductase (Old Yellow Enzyme family)